MTIVDGGLANGARGARVRPFGSSLVGAPPADGPGGDRGRPSRLLQGGRGGRHDRELPGIDRRVRCGRTRARHRRPTHRAERGAGGSGARPASGRVRGHASPCSSRDRSVRMARCSPMDRSTEVTTIRARTRWPPSTARGSRRSSQPVRTCWPSRRSRPCARRRSSSGSWTSSRSPHGSVIRAGTVPRPRPASRSPKAIAIGDHPRIVAVGFNCTAPRHLPALLAAARCRGAHGR